MVAFFCMLAFGKVVFSSKMLHKMTFSDCQILRLQSCLISAATLQIIKEKIISSWSMYNFCEQLVRWWFCFIHTFLSSQTLYERAFLLQWGQTVSLTVCRRVCFLCFPLTSVVVFGGFGIQKMPVKDSELGYDILVTVFGFPVQYKIKTFCFWTALIGSVR